MKKYKYKEYFTHTLPCLLYGLIMGAVVGTVVFLFKFSAEKLVHLSKYIYADARSDFLFAPIIFAALALFAFIMYLIQKRAPEIRGGGIPRTEGILRDRLDFHAVRTFIGTVICSLISFFAGLPLGSEGPSVLIGTSLGKLFSRKKSGAVWRRYTMTGGAAAGFAVATGAPLTGILFALEEVHRRFTPMLVIASSSAAVTAAFVNRILCLASGVSPLLITVPGVSEFTVSHGGYILLLALIVSVAVGLFDVSVSRVDTLMKKFGDRINGYIKLLIPFILTGIVGLVYPGALFGGVDIVLKTLQNNSAVSLILLVFAWRFVMVIVTSNSGVTGGTFVPTLALGALTGAIGARLLILAGMPKELYGAAVLIAMCAYLGGSMRAPLTATVFFVELTGASGNLLYTALAVFLVYIITTIADRKEFFEVVIDDMCEKQNRGKRRKIYRFEVRVSENAFVVGKRARDVLWPHASIITAIIRAKREHRIMDEDGEKKLYAGDTIVLHVQLFDEEKVLDYLYDLVGRENTIIYSEIED
jgi:H+/Cl- antiporter ClcA